MEARNWVPGPACFKFMQLVSPDKGHGAPVRLGVLLRIWANLDFRALAGGQVPVCSI